MGRNLRVTVLNSDLPVPLKFSEVSDPPFFLNPAYATGPRALLFLGLGYGYPQYHIGLPYYNRSNCSEPNSKLNPQLPHCQVRKDRNARKSLPSQFHMIET